MPVKDRYTLDEKIDLVLSITNTSDDKIYVFIPNARSEGIQLMIQPPEGYSLSRFEDESGVSLMAENEIPRNRTIERELSLSEWVTFIKPGKYSVNCKIPVEIYQYGISAAKEDNPKKVTLVESKFEVLIYE
jgi:hypothetical protein